MEFNQQQTTELVRHLITAFGGVLAGWFAAKGWLTSEQVMAIINSPTFIGIVVTGIGMAWGVISRTKKNVVASVAALPEVKAVVTEASPAGGALANVTPDNVVVAGTPRAEAFVKS